MHFYSEKHGLDLRGRSVVNTISACEKDVWGKWVWPRPAEGLCYKRTADLINISVMYALNHVECRKRLPTSISLGFSGLTRATHSHLQQPHPT